MKLQRSRQLGLVDELQGSHRFTVGVLALVLVVSLVTSGYLLSVSQPRVSSYVELAREARLAHAAMLDQETGLRAWLATGDERFLEVSIAGRKAVEEADANLLRDVADHPALIRPVVDTLLARQRWQQWATEAAATRFTDYERVDGTLKAFLLRGKGLFDAYRVEDARSVELIADLRDDALAQQRAALVTVLLVYIVGVSVSGVLTMRRRRRLAATVLRPIADLHETVNLLRAGDLSARAKATTVPELAEIGRELGRLAEDLERAGEAATSREAGLALAAGRFEMLVRVGREIAGSLSIRYVSAAVTKAAADLVEVPAVLWMRDQEGRFQVTNSSDDPVGPAGASKRCQPAELVLRAAADAAVRSDEDVRAYPLVLAGRVTGVLEVATSRVDHETEQVLAALLSTAAAALESAHLHSIAREQADHDALTQLPNRRRFEVDVDVEWSRARRYGRPLSIVMLDLDHFKRLNDEHGHQVGDRALSEAARAVAHVLRTEDTAYRYGGEEFVAVLREAGLEDAERVAERMRVAVADVVLPGLPQVTLTTSVGVATRRADMTHYTALVHAADQALYEAKRLGRDRVATAAAAALP